MAKTSSWIPHVEVFLDSSRPSKEQDASLDAIVTLVKNDLLSMEALVKEMGLYLTTTDHVIRARGILLLAELLTCLVPKRLDSVTVHSLIAFFTEKLADWQTVHGTLIGCLALLRRKKGHGTISESDARALASSFLQNIQVQSLGKRDRKLSFEFLVCLLDRHPDTIAALGDDLIYGVCEAIDGEKDPHCLMLTFHLVADLARLFPDPFGPLAGFAEDLFDVLGRYFPVHFTHPNDDFDLKRDDLSRALMLAFAATPLFEPFSIPLLLEKLSSSLPLAKVDSLKYLSNCSVKYGADIMAKHAKAIWSSLKKAIFTSSSQESILSMDPESLYGVGIQENEIVKQSLICLQKFMLQDDGLFLGLILEDEDIELIFTSVTSIKSYIDISVENKQKLCGLGCILSASAKASIACCNSVFQSFFPRLMEILGLSMRSSTGACIVDDKIVLTEKLNFGALYLCLELLAACRNLAISFEESSPGSVSVEKTLCGLLQKFSGPLTEALRSILVTDHGVCEADVYCGVKGLQNLATFPGGFKLISKSTLENTLTTFVSIMTAGCKNPLLQKLTLKALVEIGTFIEIFHDSEKALSFMTIVVEKVVALISLDDSTVTFPLQLEAMISDIGATGPKFMLRVTQGLEEAISANFLEAYVRGKLKSVRKLIPLLKCYSSKVLPWFSKNEDFESVALRFSVIIWDQIESNISVDIGVQEKELLDEMMAAMKIAVAGCSEDNQGLILQKAFSVLSSSAIFKESVLFSGPTKLDGLQGLGELPCRDNWVVSLFSSVVIALRPQTPFPNVREIAKLFTAVLLKGNVPSAQALGSVINKLPLKINRMEDTSACTLEEVVDIVFNMGIFQSNTMIGMAWVGKGLVMRGHEKVREVVMVILRCLLSSSTTITSQLEQEMLQKCSKHDPDALDMRSAADAFHVLLSDSDACMNKRFHATIRPLYKQHFCFTMMPILLSSIKESNSSTTRSMLYRAFGHVICNTPLAAVVTDAKRLVYVLLDGISILSGDVLDKDLTYSLLLVLSGMLMDENGRETVADNAHLIINCLIELISYPYMMLVRETAIQCLVAVSGLPHTRIYPMRTQVLKAILKALDDPKRTVRREAVRCRQAWTSITTRSFHF